MHHFRSASAVVHFRLAVLLWLVNCLLVPITAGLLLHSLWSTNLGLTMAGSSLAILSLGLVVAHWATGAHTDCPLCWTPVLAPKASMRHRQAQMCLGSHRLRVALAILCKNQFRCPYCNESTALELPNTLHRPPNRWAQLD